MNEAPQPGPTRVPRHVGSTYRLQLNRFGFEGATQIVPFLRDLGVETLYVSPVTRARAGSTHGYDVVDPTVIDPGLGSRADFDLLLQTLHAHGMAMLIDIVPNHMAASVENPYFADVLRFGRASRYAPVFDIAWEAADNTVVLPVLDGSVHEAMDAGRLRVIRPKAGSGYLLAYDDLRLPLDPGGDDDIAADLVDLKDLKDPPARRYLELLVSHQHYRLVDWRTAAHSVNYRRFFDINDLIGVRQEDPDVFELTHELVMELASDPRVAGLRVDHIDGLRDPELYLSMLRDALDAQTHGSAARPVVVVEKIIDHDEQLPGWPVDGTTGYEFASMLTGLFIDPEGANHASTMLAVATGDDRPFRIRARDAKRQAIVTSFPGRLAYTSTRLSRAIARSGSRPNPAEVADAVRELTAELAVYRTYRQPNQQAAASDRRSLDEAAARARERWPADPTTLDQVLAVLEGPTDPTGYAWEAIATWQQFTPAAVAKGVEDTALYTPGTLLATADVGSNPDRPAVSPEELHKRLSARARQSPGGLSTLSTHDSKRSHDVRCRLAVLSEIAEQWAETANRLEAHHVGAGPDTQDRRYVYETLVGAWPLDGAIDADFIRRIQDHVVKAAREAKRNSSWQQPDERYEGALRSFSAEVLDNPLSRGLLESVVTSVERPGATNSLSAVVVRAAAPGIPDIYQGDEQWFLALVDPDNRRPVDFAHHSAALRSLSRMTPAALLEQWRDGRVKQAVLRRTLHARRDLPELFHRGEYLPLRSAGSAAEHVVAFARQLHDQTIVAIVPRMAYRLCGPDAFPLGVAAWGDTTVALPGLDQPAAHDLLTGQSTPAARGTIVVADVLRELPVALLVVDRG